VFGAGIWARCGLPWLGGMKRSAKRRGLLSETLMLPFRLRLTFDARVPNAPRMPRQPREAVVADPEKSDRAIAAAIGVAPNTVKAARATVQNCAVGAVRIGRDGRTRGMPADASLRAEGARRLVVEAMGRSVAATVKTSTVSYLLPRIESSEIPVISAPAASDGVRDEVEAMKTAANDAVVEAQADMERVAAAIHALANALRRCEPVAFAAALGRENGTDPVVQSLGSRRLGYGVTRTEAKTIHAWLGEFIGM
jgi:hypothetical protein